MNSTTRAYTVDDSLDLIIRQNTPLALEIAEQFFTLNRSRYRFLESGDIEGESFLALCEIAGTWDASEPFDSFLRKELPRWLRSSADKLTQARRVLKRDESAPTDQAADTSAPSETGLVDEMCEQLSEDEKQIVLLMSNGITKQTELAEALGCHRETIARRLESIRQKTLKLKLDFEQSRASTYSQKCSASENYYRKVKHRVRAGQRWSKLRARDQAAKGSKT